MPQLSPFWDEIDRCVSLAARYHDFELTRSHQRGCVWEGQSETCIYRMTHTRLQITARMEDRLVRSEFLVLSCIPPKDAPIKQDPMRQEFMLEGSVMEDQKFVFSDESASTELIHMLKRLLCTETVIRLCIDKGLSVNSTQTGNLSTVTISKDRPRFFPRLRFDCALAIEEERLISVHFVESYLFSATADPPSGEPLPLHIANTSELLRFIESKMDHPRLAFFWSGWFQRKGQQPHVS